MSFESCCCFFFCFFFARGLDLCVCFVAFMSRTDAPAFAAVSCCNSCVCRCVRSFVVCLLFVCCYCLSSFVVQSLPICSLVQTIDSVLVRRQIDSTISRDGVKLRLRNHSCIAGVVCIVCNTPHILLQKTPQHKQRLRMIRSTLCFSPSTSQILLPATAAARGAVLKRLVAIADELRQLNNYQVGDELHHSNRAIEQCFFPVSQGAFAFVCALISTPITR